MMGDVNIGQLIASLGLDVEEFKKDLDAIKRESDNAFKKVERSWEETTRKMAEDTMKVGKSMKSFGRSLAMNISAPLAAVGTAMLKSEMDFERYMTKMISLVGISRSQMGEWRDDILKMAPEVARMPAELAEAMYFITSAGLRGAEALETLRASAMASVAGAGEVKQVADVVTSAMNAFKKSGLTATEAVNTLVAAIRFGKVESEDLAVGIGHVFPAAAKLKVSFDQVGAAIAAMTRTGTPAETAAVQLRQVLGQLIGPAREAHQALEQMGWSAAAFRRHIAEEGLFSALNKFTRLVNKFGIEEAKKVFGNVRALTSVFDLMGENAEHNAMIFEEMTDNSSELNRAIRAVQRTLYYKWNSALAQMKTTMIEVGQAMKKAVIPYLQDLSSWLKETAKWFASLTQEEQLAILKKIAFAAAIGPVIIVLGQLVTVIGAVIKTIVALKIEAGLLAGAWRMLSTAVASNPLGAIAVVLSAAAASLMLFKDRTKEAAKAQHELGDAVKYANKEIGKQIMEQLFPKFKAGSIVDTTKSLEEFEKAVEKMSFKELQSLEYYLKNQLPDAVRALAQAEPSIKPVLQEDLTFLQNMLKFVKGEIEATEEAIENAGKATKKAFGKKPETVSPAWVFEDIQPPDEGLFKPGTELGEWNMLGATVSEVKDEFASLNMQAKLFGEKRADTLKKKMDFVKQSMISLADEGFDKNSKALQYLYLQFYNLRTAYDIASARQLKGVWESIGDELDETNMILQTLKSSVSDVTTAFGKMFTSTKGGWAELVSSILSSIKQIMDALLAKAIAGVIAGEVSSKGLLGLATAAVGVAALKQMWDNLVPSLAEGGMAYGRTLAEVGEYPGARSNPEVIAPLDKLENMIEKSGGGMSGEVVFEIDGYKLKGILQKVENKTRRLG